MILNKHTDADKANRLETLSQRLRRQGYRMTPQRRTVLETLIYSDRHPGAEDLYRQAKGLRPDLSRATVYKTLDLLKDLGEVLEIEFREHGSGNRYDGLRPQSHPHLVCTECGAIEDASVDPMAGNVQALAAAAGYRLDGYRVDLYGHCPQCQERATKVLRPA